MNSSTDYSLNPPSWVTRFLWWCAGADNYFLNLSPKQDRVKYAGIGGIVLCTGVLAAFSGGFAFHTIFGPKGDAMEISGMTTFIDIVGSAIFGICWGLIIFNLDRFIISSTGKGDGTDVITGKEMLQALPRIIIALILGFAISAPLEIKILESEINAELQKFQESYVQDLNKETDKVANQQKAVLEKRKTEYEFKLSVYQKELKVYDDAIDNLVSIQQNEMQDKRAYGFGPVAKKMQSDIDNKKVEKDKFLKDKEKEVKALNDQLTKVNFEIDNYESDLRKAYAKNKEVAGGYSGLLKRIQISHEIGGWIPWIILLVFLSIETGPIFFKMMMNKGVYDFLVENHNKRREVENGIWKEDFAFEGKDGIIHMEKWHFMEMDNAKVEKMNKLDAQKNISEKAIEEWEKKKLNDLAKNPQDFYTEGSRSTIDNNA
jgi:hypothetical protein